jgi:hypothetical protein
MRSRPENKIKAKVRRIAYSLRSYSSNVLNAGVVAYFRAGALPKCGTSSEIHFVTRTAIASRKVVPQFVQKVKMSFYHVVIA